MAEHVLKAESEEDPGRGQDEDTGICKDDSYPFVNVSKPLSAPQSIHTPPLLALSRGMEALK